MKEIYSLEDDLDYLNKKIHEYTKTVKSFIEPYNPKVSEYNKWLMFFELEKERILNDIRDKKDYEEYIYSCS